LSCGFVRAFTDTERAQLAVLHLFRDTVDMTAIHWMGDPDFAGEDVVPELAELDVADGFALLDRAADIGLLTELDAGSGSYQIHPALPWYFGTLFTASYGQASSPAAQRAARAYTKAVAGLGDYYFGEAEEGRVAEVLPALQAEEANLRHALDLARAWELWDMEVGCLQGLCVLYERTGRDGEWAQVVAEISADFIDPDTGGPLPGRGNAWSIVTGYRVGLAKAARDWATATTLQNATIAWDRDRAAEALAVPAASLTSVQRTQIRNLAVAVSELGNILVLVDDPACLPHLREALMLAQRIGDRPLEAETAACLGNAYLIAPGLRDLDQAGHWFRHSLSVRDDGGVLGRAKTLTSLGDVASLRLDDDLAASEAMPVVAEHRNAALGSYQQALDLLPDGDPQRGTVENQLGNVYAKVGDARQALRHYQQSIQHHEARGDIYTAGLTRFNIALLLAGDDRASDALHYARAALDNFQQAGPGAASDAADAEELITDLEQAIAET
jgi:tetratricopeptide (TPR) repeat protein